MLDLEKRGNEAYKLVMSKREEYLRVWIAANGLHPNECMLVEDRVNGFVTSHVYALSRDEIEQTVKNLAKERWMEIMETKLEDARKVIEWYGDEGNWAEENLTEVGPSKAEHDSGTRARELLERWGG